jgi:hypothetical protein
MSFLGMTGANASVGLGITVFVLLYATYVFSAIYYTERTDRENREKYGSDYLSDYNRYID